MAIWLTDTRRPRRCAGAISAIYMGVDMEAMPMPMPPSQRNRMKVQMSRGSEVPMAEVRKSIAARSSAFLRPNRSEMGPTISTPVAQPISTQPDAQPFITTSRWKRAVRNSMAPEMTPVS